MNIKHLLSVSFIVSAITVSAQDANKTYAITGNGTNDFMWMNIRQVDISSGKIVKDIYQYNKTPSVMSDAVTKKTVNQANEMFGTGPTASMVAAAAYDKVHDKLFFTPMRIGELRWLDLSAKGDVQHFYTVQSQLLNPGNLMDEANHITRMVINADGNGYAITNDANHLFRFTTGKKVTITDLGNIVDADLGQSGISIHNKCSSWGGDIVADAYNKLYVITASHNVFIVDVDTRIAIFKGTILGLPGTYTTNGAAVDGEGKIVVSSANSFGGYYKFDISDMKATLIEGSDKVYNASDLANGNLLLQKEADLARNLGAPVLPKLNPLNADTRVFPNPVTANEFKVSFDGMNAGEYTIALTDLSGRAIMNKVVNIYGKSQAERVQITSKIAKGMYFVKVSNAARQNVFTERIAVQ